MRGPILLVLLVGASVGYQISLLHTTDIHGWVLGHRHLPGFNAALGDFLSLAQRLDALEPHFMLLDSGDVIEGTGFSDSTYPHGKLVYDAMRQLPYEALTCGNHDVGHAENVEFLATKFAPSWDDRYITSNVFYQDENTPLGSSQYRISQDAYCGKQVLILGYLYDFDGAAENAYVVFMEDSVRQPYFREALSHDIDAIVVIAHIAADQPELMVLYHAIRSIRPTTPLVLLVGHSHVEAYGKLDDNAYFIESDHYFRHLGLVEMTIESGRITLFNHSFLDTSREEFYRVTGTTAETFMTPEGTELNSRLEKEFAELNLTTLVGCSRRTYPILFGESVDDRTVFDIFIESALPSTLFVSYPLLNIPVAIMSRGALRDNLYVGEVIEDDLIAIVPFDDGYTLTSGISGKDMNAFQTYLREHPGPDHGDPALDPVPEKKTISASWVFSSGTISHEGTYDLVAGGYDSVFFTRVLEKILPGKYSTIEYADSRMIRSVLRQYVQESPEFKCSIQ